MHTMLGALLMHWSMFRFPEVRLVLRRSIHLSKASEEEVVWAFENAGRSDDNRR
jgi:hypothetical protein